MKILGINSVFHDLSAAIVVDGTLVAACEEERFTRIKHAKPARVDNPHHAPEHAIRFCLDRAAVHARDIDYVAYSFDPALRRTRFRLDPLSLPGDWGDKEGERMFLDRLDEVRGAVAMLLDRPLDGALKFLPHHIAHAASAYYPSGFDGAAILVVDGIGEVACSTLAYGEGTSIQIIDSLEYPHSLGLVWVKISTYLGFSELDAGKTMGLAVYGRPDVFAREFASFIRVTEDNYTIDPEVMRFRLPDFAELEKLFGPARKPGTEMLPHHRDVAAALQAVTNAALVALARRLKCSVDLDRLCIAGGVGLNCITNTLVKEAGGFSEVFIPPAPNDAGTAIGAAFAVHYANAGGRPANGDASPYLGPQFNDDQILSAIRAAGLIPKRSKNAAKDAAAMIAEGKVVAWFQGRMEFGPRALGNRSLLADPRRADMREVLNRKIKHREEFRPFAPSVLAEHAHDWFDLGRLSPSHEYMLFTCPAKPEQRERIPAVLHRDGTARLHLVRREANPRFHELLSHLFALTSVPLVLNTSFNDSEPIICTPAQAIATFRQTSIDVLFMGDFYLTPER